MDGPDEIRIARNEARRREVNEAIEAGRSERSGSVGFVCECGRLGCTVVLELDLDAYEAVRRRPRRFFVTPGHEEPEVEDVVERTEHYLVVEKTGLGGEIAEARDPRDPG